MPSQLSFLKTPSMTHNHLQHEGELAVQRQRGIAPHITEDLPHYIWDQMPMQHALFFTNLLYFAVANLDAQGRPWATLLVGTEQQPSPVRMVDLETLEVHTELPSWDPFRRSLGLGNATSAQTNVWAGLGVDFSNRRRNKVAGVIKAASINGDDLRMMLETNENLGNCPKYITVRQLVPSQPTPQLAVDAFDAPDVPLSSEAVALVHRASSVFLATRHVTSQPETTDMGLNHRGGSPGFIRVERNERGEPSAIIIPDYSGNRFYQSLGNVQTDRLAGLVIPCFQTRDILHVTGTAENIFDAAAEAIMPRVTLLTRIRITGYVYIRNRIGLQMIGPESFSPYNPPVRLLQSELQTRGFQATKDDGGETTATLVDTQCLSASISSFTFELSRPVQYTPGGFVVLDFSATLQRTYRHMNELNPQQVNDDFVRTWTISSAPPFDPLTGRFTETTRITCTIKHVENGAVTPFLHRQRIDASGRRLRVPVRGVGGDFSVFSTKDAQGAVTVDSPKMLWIAAGVGLTPFMAFASGLDHADDSSADVVLMVAARGEEASVAPRVFAKYPFVKQVTVFDSKPTADPSPSTGAYHARRMHRGDLASIRDLTSRTVYLCGPPAFMAGVTKMLQEEGVAPHQIKQESFAF